MKLTSNTFEVADYLLELMDEVVLSSERFGGTDSGQSLNESATDIELLTDAIDNLVRNKCSPLDLVLDET